MIIFDCRSAMAAAAMTVADPVEEKRSKAPHECSRCTQHAASLRISDLNSAATHRVSAGCSQRRT